jgi:hypothetical protein
MCFDEYGRPAGGNIVRRGIMLHSECSRLLFTNELIDFFYLLNTCSPTMTPGLTQPVTEIRTKNFPWC